MNELLITRVEGGILYLRTDLSGGWLVPDDGAGAVLVYPSTSSGNATYSSADGTVTILAPIEAAITTIGPTSEVFTPNLVPKAFEVEVAGISSTSSVFEPGLTPQSFTITPASVGSSSLVSEPSLVPGPVEVAPQTIAPTSKVSPVSVRDATLERERKKERKRKLFRQTIGGFFGPTEMRTRIYVTDRRGEDRVLLDGVTGASVECNNFRDATWSLALEMRRNLDFDPVRDYVLVVIEVRVQDGRGFEEWRKYPMGLYRFRAPSGDYMRSHTTWSLTGQSLESLILEDPIRGVYTVPANSFVLASVKNILIEASVPEGMINLPHHQDRRVSTAQVFDPFAEEAQSSKLRVCNALLAAGGFAALWCDRRGRFTSAKLTALSNRPPSVRYAPDGEHLMLDGVSEEKNEDRFANVVVVSSQDPEQEPPITAIAENNDPNSPGSYAQLGYWKVKEVKMQTISSREAAQEIANHQLKAASSYYQTITYRSKPDPERTARERMSASVEGFGTVALEGEFDVGSFSFDAHPMMREMSFTANRVRSVGEGWS